ncbi:MAG: hypothetical protein LUQ31_04380 [Methanoregula sp.]|nr:hypothetical protein [Methanoregula sp.]
MTESVITEFSGSQRESVSRIYRYGVSGVQVLDGHERLRRLYRFDPSANMMTENEPSAPQKILRRFVFDTMGMLEETFSFGQPPRTFHYENGGRQIVMRGGGDYGAVGKTYSFEKNGVAETAFGRDGGMERAYIFEPGGESITIRKGGWYGDIERRLVCERIDTSVFLEPDAFLQFLMFTEKSARETEDEIDEQVAKIRGSSSSSGAGRNRFAYTGERHTSDADVESAGPAAVREAGRMPDRSGYRDEDRPARRPAMQARDSDDAGIDFIPDSDSPPEPRSSIIGTAAPRNRSGAIPFDERWQSATNDHEELTRGRSASISLEERFRSSRDDDRTLTEGRSARIPLDERFQSSRDEDRTLTSGRSASIPLDERFQSAENEKEELTPGRSAQISYEERKAGRKMQ